METYLKIYRWSMRMKLRMGVYTVALLFFKIIWNWINGIFSVQSVDILTIWGVCLLFAMLETVILPEGKDPTVLRTVIWIVAANIIFCGGAVLTEWFSGIPVWGTVGLVLFLELAVGFNTPAIIKYSFWRMTYDWPDATYACLNFGEAFAPDEIKEKSICINGDIGAILNQLKSQPA